MFKDVIKWRMIRAQVLEAGVSKRQAARDAGIHWSTLKRVLKFPFPPRYARRSHGSLRKRQLNRSPLPKQKTVVADIRNKVIESAVFIRETLPAIPRSAALVAELSRLTRLLHENGIAPSFSSKSTNLESKNHYWIQQILMRNWGMHRLAHECVPHPELEKLLRKARSDSLQNRRKAIVVLAKLKGISLNSIHRFLQGSQSTIQGYWKNFQAGGCESLFARKCRPKQADDAEFRAVVIALLHSPPTSHGFNRTTWKWNDLVCCLRKQGYSTCRDTLRAIIKTAGFRWRKAKIVLTSNDPEYRNKLDHLKSILLHLGENDRFFSIDEFGPFSLKIKGGKRLVSPCENHSIPQFQKSKGCLIVTAALELSHNQVTHFYSRKKNTLEMVKLLEVLVKEYATCRKLYFSWDAAGWHASKMLYETVEYHNAFAAAEGGNGLPLIELVPLPASAQFLNVIESVFSGMARAIIHNSDYQSEGEAKSAIDLYFQERNKYFKRNPKRAGKTIWGLERVPPVFSEEQNCKDPLFR